MTEDFWTIPGRRTEPWRAFSWPPQGVIGWPLGEPVILVAADDVAISLEDITVFPAGMRMVLVVRSPGEAKDHQIHELQQALAPRLHGEGWRPKGLDPGRLRLGVGYADGRKANNLFADVGPVASEEGGLRLGHLGGEYSDVGANMGMWLEPLPPPGSVVTFACEWPARGIPLTQRQVGSDRILEAAARAVVLWETGQPGPPSRRTLGPS